MNAACGGKIRSQSERIIRRLQRRGADRPAADGRRDITDYIMEKYKGMVKAKARSMFLLGGDSDDLIQEGMIGLFKAVRDYDSGRDASFSTFAELCVSRQMYTAVQASTRKKHMPLNTYISLYGAQGEAEETELMNAIPAEARKARRSFS